MLQLFFLSSRTDLYYQILTVYFFYFLSRIFQICSGAVIYIILTSLNLNCNFQLNSHYVQNSLPRTPSEFHIAKCYWGKAYLHAIWGQITNGNNMSLKIHVLEFKEYMIHSLKGRWTLRRTKIDKNTLFLVIKIQKVYCHILSRKCFFNTKRFFNTS